MNNSELAKRILARIQNGNSLSVEARAFIDEYCEGVFSRTAPLIFKKAIPDDLRPCQVLGVETLVMLPAVDLDTL